MEYTKEKLIEAADTCFHKIMREKLSTSSAIDVARFKRYFLEHLELKEVYNPKQTWICPLCKARISGDCAEEAQCKVCDMSFAEASALFEGTRKRDTPAYIAHAPKEPEKTWTCIGCEHTQPVKRAKCVGCGLDREISMGAQP